VFGTAGGGWAWGCEPIILRNKSMERAGEGEANDGQPKKAREERVVLCSMED